MEPLLTSLTFDPSRADFEPYGLTCVHWIPSPMRRPDHHNEIELNFLQSGKVSYLLGGRKVVVEAGRLSVFWGAIPHQIIECENESAYFVATIPLPWFLQWQLPAPFVSALLRGEMLAEQNGHPTDAEYFSRWETDLQEHTPDNEHCVLLEMQARLLRLAATHANTVHTTPRPELKPGLSKVEIMACFIAQHYNEKLTVERIAHEVGLHPNYAMSIFQKTLGATIVDYITKYRVSHAQRVLVTTDKKVLEVATDSGFASLSRFNEAFRQICGCSPRDYRQSHLL